MVADPRPTAVHPDKTPLAAAPNLPDFGYDSQQDRDQTVVWFAPEASVEGLTPLRLWQFAGSMFLDNLSRWHPQRPVQPRR